ncbi:MAG: hypothetical protein KIS96_11790 [Bauldia sp.]|nr:hypothetical protein [Bauldia sp.]
MTDLTTLRDRVAAATGADRLRDRLSSYEVCLFLASWFAALSLCTPVSWWTVANGGMFALATVGAVTRRRALLRTAALIAQEPDHA